MRPEPPCMDDRRAGLTLVEMLVVLGLMALIGVFMSGGLSAVRSALPLNTAMADADEIAVARDHLRRTISEATAQSILRQAVHFEGAPDAVGFVAAADPIFEAPGLVRVLLRMEIIDGRPALVERRRLDREEQTPETGAAVVIRDIAGLSFRYVRGGLVLSTIGKGEALPDRVIIDITFPAGDPRRFSTLDVPLVCAPPPEG
jgi:Prokaryotic N-terminal methylation motif